MSWKKTKKGQVSIEQILILGFVLLIGLLILNFFGFFSDQTSTKINQSKIYWSSIASPFKISEFGIYKYQAQDGVLLVANLKITNPTSEKLTIKKLIFSSADFEDVYEGQTYLGKANNLEIKFFPSQTKLITVYSFEPNSKPNLYNPSKVFESYLTIYFDSALPNQIQQGSVPLVDYISEYSGYYSQSKNLFNNQTGCPIGFEPCPDTQNCVPTGLCLSNGSACLPPNSICGANNCCPPTQICFGGSCVNFGSINCSAPNILCGPDANNSYSCCDFKTSICDPNSKQCVVCSSPNSIPCNRVCCPDGQFCNQYSSSCLSSCSSPNFVCPAGSSNCCDGSIYSYCEPKTGSCLRASECAPPNITCGPDSNGITYCCDGTKSICNLTTRTCQNCPSGIACNNQCCKENYLCINGSCYCPIPQRYYIGGEEFCCPANQIYNYSTGRCEPCVNSTISCVDKCCESNTICDLSNIPTTCTNCCPENTFNCEDKYCCKYSDACIAGHCINYCPAGQIACQKPNGTVNCCPSNTFCSQPDGSCIPTCEESRRCGKFCCLANQYCYDGRCVDSYPQPPKCPSELYPTCPQNQTCGIVGVDEFGNAILLNQTCCAPGQYCANYSGQCCNSQPCPRIEVFNTSYGSVQVMVGECCIGGSCMPQLGQNLSNQTCCVYNTTGYTYREGPAQNYNETTLSFSNFCGRYCCPDGTFCINSQSLICCPSNQTCRAGNSSTGYNISCCPQNYTCGSVQSNPPSNNYGDLTHVCCPPNRQCTILGNSSVLPSSCCPEGKSCANGICCDNSNYCPSSDPTKSLCCNENSFCIYQGISNYTPLCCPLQNIYKTGSSFIDLDQQRYSLNCCNETVVCINQTDKSLCDPPSIQGNSIRCAEGCNLKCGYTCSDDNLCINSSKVSCCIEGSNCIKRSDINDKICCPYYQQAFVCENGADPPNCSSDQICCMDQNQILDVNGQKYCCINNATTIFVKCGNNCCPKNLCKTDTTSTVFSCCNNTKDVLCRISDLEYVCCPEGKCLNYVSNKVGSCCTWEACPYSHECCPPGTVCTDKADPDNSSTNCCPEERYLYNVKVDAGGMLMVNIFDSNSIDKGNPVCCPKNRTLYTPGSEQRGVGFACCPPGTYPISNSTPICCSYNNSWCKYCPYGLVECYSQNGLQGCCPPGYICLGAGRDPEPSPPRTHSPACCPPERYVNPLEKTLGGFLVINKYDFVCCSSRSIINIQDSSENVFVCCPEDYPIPVQDGVNNKCCKDSNLNDCLFYLGIGGGGGTISP